MKQLKLNKEFFHRHLAVCLLMVGLGCWFAYDGLVTYPKTPADALLPFLPHVDLVLIMTVEPGFGGQSFMMDQLPKINIVRGMINSQAPGCELEVDGGVDVSTAPLAVKAGADVLVAGSSIFGKADRAAAIRDIRNAIKNL